MKNQWITWLVTISVMLLTACGGGGGGGSSSGGVVSYPASTVSWRIPDSGQTSCYYDYISDGFYSPLESTFCPDPGSGWSPDGQDGYYTINAMSFTDKGDGTILDNVTGLNWKKCSLGESGNDCMSGSIASLDWGAANTQCLSLGAGWRLPTLVELTRIIDYGQSFGTIDVAFPATVSGYWTSTPHPTYAGYAWIVDFSQGNTWIDYETNTNYVRCVRG